MKTNKTQTKTSLSSLNQTSSNQFYKPVQYNAKYYLASGKKVNFMIYQNGAKLGFADTIAFLYS
jgi:hypothetical protein